MIITSDRRFGIEIEFYCKTHNNLRRVSNTINVVGDGSIRHIPNSGEYVSPILSGESGEKTINYACEVLKKNGASAESPSVSVHVHIDGGRKSTTPVVSPSAPDITDDVVRSWAFSGKVSSTFSPSQLTEFIKNGIRVNQTVLNGVELKVFRADFDGIIYHSLAQLERKPTRNYVFYTLYRSNRVKWLRNMFYFYTKYSTVMEDIVSNSRKFGNMYCIPLASSYELQDIEACQTEDDLMNVWYKCAMPSGHYDDSRYHAVNLHSYWDRHGTVEIRSHGGTIDPIKILLWVKLHQKIADKLEHLTIDDIRLKDGEDLHKSFIEFVEEPVLKNYVKRLLGFYSNIIIK